MVAKVILGTRRAWAGAILIGLGMTALSLVLHFAPVWITMLNQGAFTWDHKPLPYDFLVDCIREHQEVAAFARRPLMTWAIEGLSGLGVAPAAGFIAIGHFFFMVSGLLVFGAALRVGSSIHGACLAQVIFHASPTILFAWFTPMYTYDEPMQYVAMLAAIAAWTEGRSLLFMLAFTLALMTRESSILLVPSLIFVSPIKAQGTTSPRRIREEMIALMVPLLIYGCFLLFQHSPDQLLSTSVDELISRGSLISFNFQNATRSLETLWYFYLVMGLPLFLLLRYRRSLGGSAHERRIIQAFMVALLINTVLVLFMTQAREARLFALPLLFVWPLLGRAFLSEMDRHGGWRSFLHAFFSVRAVILFGALLLGIYLLVLKSFPMSTGIQQDNPFHEYIALQTLFMIACVLVDRRAAPLLHKEDKARS